MLFSPDMKISDMTRKTSSKMNKWKKVELSKMLNVAKVFTKIARETCLTEAKLLLYFRLLPIISKRNKLTSMIKMKAIDKIAV